jgi:hypothetical protein
MLGCDTLLNGSAPTLLHWRCWGLLSLLLLAFLLPGVLAKSAIVCVWQLSVQSLGLHCTHSVGFHACATVVEHSTDDAAAAASLCGAVQLVWPSRG